MWLIFESGSPIQKKGPVCNPFDLYLLWEHRYHKSQLQSIKLVQNCQLNTVEYNATPNNSLFFVLQVNIAVGFINSVCGFVWCYLHWWESRHVRQVLVQSSPLQRIEKLSFFIKRNSLKINCFEFNRAGVLNLFQLHTLINLLVRYIDGSRAVYHISLSFRGSK